MSSVERVGNRIEYRCRACGHAFEDRIAGVVACPRCQSIADHEQLSHGPR